MAARFRKLGVTTVGACAGAALAAWVLNPFERSPYSVSVWLMLPIKFNFNKYVYRDFCAGKCSVNCNATRQTTIAVTQWTSEHLAKWRRIRCAYHWRWCDRCRLRLGLDHKRCVEASNKFRFASLMFFVFFFLFSSSSVGLKTALIEGDDFASGTSSRSTKLIHGGVRYLQKAILGVNDNQRTSRNLKR